MIAEYAGKKYCDGHKKRFDHRLIISPKCSNLFLGGDNGKVPHT
jgi:hypothetical protein